MTAGLTVWERELIREIDHLARRLKLAEQRLDKMITEREKREQ